MKLGQLGVNSTRSLSGLVRCVSMVKIQLLREASLIRLFGQNGQFSTNRVSQQKPKNAIVLNMGALKTNSYFAKTTPLHLLSEDMHPHAVV